jgi:putative nucleotidyltransferase with HDIG domain
MASNNGQGRRFFLPDRAALKIILLIITSGFSLASLVLPISTRPASFPLKIGDVAAQDITAPDPLVFDSPLLTEQTRQEVVNQVSPVYIPADPSIARHQIERLRVALNYITAVRQDNYATPQQKQSDLSGLSDIQLSTAIADPILALNDNRWQVVQQEAAYVLEQTMRNTIREDSLDEARRNIPTLVSFSIPQVQASIVIELVSPFVCANSLYSTDQTQAAQEQARASVQPIKRSFVAGEVIVLRGQVINAESWEALQQFGLIKPPSNNQDMIASVIMVVALTFTVFLYFYRRKIATINDLRSLGLIALTFLVFLFAARFLIPNRTIVPYIFPLPAFGLALAAVFSQEISLVLSLVISILAAYGLPNSLDLTIFYFLSSMCGILMLGRARRIASFFWAGLIVGATGAGIILAYRIPGEITDWIGLATLVGVSFVNGMISASLTLLLQYLFSQLLGLTTTLQLLEISRPDHPLLHFILRSAPGTYQHSLQVANLGEQAAESIGADALLVRVGAIYHDTGKATNPHFFIENQVPGKTNPHDDIEPRDSAAIIIQHVADGLLLARKYRLPPPIMDFICEHHGTFITRYQYAQALEAADHNPELVDMNQFRYPGPSPRSRETALLMMADGVEASARAELPKNEEELRALVRRTIDYCQKEGQLENTNLTMRDLSTITESFVRTLQGTYHPRIRYPELRSSLNVETTPRKTNSSPNPLEPTPQTHDLSSNK